MCSVSIHTFEFNKVNVPQFVPQESTLGLLLCSPMIHDVSDHFCAKDTQLYICDSTGSINLKASLIAGYAEFSKTE